MKKFHLSDILTITTGKLVSTRHMEGVFDILNYMTDDNLFTHQLPKANQECIQYLLEQYPQLKDINSNEVNSNNWKEWLNEQINKFGEELEVAVIPK